jgi:hypothetical protein
MGLMAMGAEARESPAGNTWDGVAIAVFVKRTAFAADLAAFR